MSTETTTTRLATLKAQAAKSYAQKDYSAASDSYAQACELQSSINGDDNPQNAHLLYLYGRSLFQVALTKSDVLGGKPVEEQDEKEKKGGIAKGKGKDVSEAGGEGNDEKLKAPAPVVGAKGGFFSFTGDENWDDSEEEGEDADAGGDGDVEKEGDDDFTLAWEILDFARVLFLKQLGSSKTADDQTTGTNEVEPIVQETTTDTSNDPITSIPNPDSALPAASSASTSTETKPDFKTLKTALADTYDLLGEVSLESESFPQATKDLRSSLELKLKLYPPSSTLISEAHFKLSLALEFAAAGEGVTNDDRRKGREEAAVQMELAIASCRARITKEEAELKELGTDGDKDGKAKKSLEEAREMVGELEVRLADLRSATPSPTLADAQDDDQLRGILGQVLGEDPEEARKRIAEVVGRANDLSGLVRKKPASASAEPAPATAGASTVIVPINGGKRKLEDVVEEEPVEELEIPKKVKLQDEAKPEAEAEEKVEGEGDVKP
ncbi:unnamed protein product [Tuber melanosporum]|uniref:(Perigord truffle) hypothetical protein n=1 Tax=Tuber melanosporum (strain Mel28) TaxID=656061 RepID=D5GBR5_TUBMM|nr:uncharacterized protein GSTUM_00005538001 [Tuber melanosporum]CAZ81915.1 unnamed protein product [Tuber melanosporum]